MTTAAVFPDRAVLLSAVKSKLAEYAGTAVTVRQLYYRLVANGTIPNSLRSYKNLGAALTLWRRSRQLPYSAFEDRTRGMKEYDEGWRHDNPDGWLGAYLKGAIDIAKNYKLARWALQDTKVVVAVEKQALEGPFAQVCEELGVDLAVCRGYASLSFLNEMAARLNETEADATVVLYFGDFDPSGMNIPETVTRDLRGQFGVGHVLERIALNEEQVADMGLVPAPVKLTDSRSGGFIEEHGEDVYELDAIEPGALQGLIRDAVDEYWDEDRAEEREAAEEKGRRRIARTLKKHRIEQIVADLLKDAPDGEDGP